MQGYFDGAMVQLTKRHQQRRKKRKGPDERAIITGQRLPGPGQRQLIITSAQHAVLQSCDVSTLLLYHPCPEALWTPSVDNLHILACTVEGHSPPASYTMGSLCTHSGIFTGLCCLMHVPGDPSRTGLQLEEMTWTVRCDESMTVTSVPLSERPAAFGYLVRESDRFASMFSSTNKAILRELQCSMVLTLCSDADSQQASGQL